MRGMSVLALLLALATAPAGAQLTQSASGPRGFRAITGPAAAQFRVPPEMRLVAREQRASGSSASISVERYRQFLGDVEVLGAQLTVYRSDGGGRDAVIGAHYPNLAPANRVRLSRDGARSIAAARRAGAGATWTVDLMIHPDSGRYFYRVESRSLRSRWFYWIDAETGEMVNEYDGLTTGSGLGVHQDWKSLAALTTKYRGSYRMVSPGNRLKTNDAQGSVTIPGAIATDSNDIWDRIGRTSPGQGALVDAHFNANVTDQYYLTQQSFDFARHYSQGIVSSAHVGDNYSNAYWNGAQIAFGDGDGVNYLEFSADLDVVAHEISHGVTDATSRLIYQNESGALSEAFSDIMGTAVEFHHEVVGNWTIAEDVTVGGRGLRNMADPVANGHPSHYKDLQVGAPDNGYVHVNSGIVNHWFYLLTVGGQNADENRRSGTNVAGIGLDAAVDIAYLGFTALPASANFCTARSATVAAAGGHAGSVTAAWDEVGVTVEVCAGIDTTPPQIFLMAAERLSRTSYEISWHTDEPSDSEVRFTTGNAFKEFSLVTEHAMIFTGKRNETYTYTVRSTDAAGNIATRGPYSFRLR